MKVWSVTSTLCCIVSLASLMILNFFFG
jgi:hypothetical protein